VRGVIAGSVPPREVGTVGDLLGWTRRGCDTTHRTGVRCQLADLHAGYHLHVGATVTVMWGRHRQPAARPGGAR